MSAERLNGAEQSENQLCGVWRLEAEKSSEWSNMRVAPQATSQEDFSNAVVGLLATVAYIACAIASISVFLKRRNAVGSPWIWLFTGRLRTVET
jgi:hypothetical protein